LPEIAGDAALLVDPFDTRSIEQAIESLLADPSLRDELVEKGSERVSRYTAGSAAGRIAEIYKNLLSSSRSID
jgi:glycosyltransferase involved in cell wall biosynthesis